jgi:hypothetical protein
VAPQVSEGYVVVVRELEDAPEYKGMDRTPGNMEELGLEDPWLSGEYPDDTGLLPTAAFAQRILSRYAEAFGRDSVELIYGRIWDGAEPRLVSDELRFIGFDVAGEDLHFCSAIKEYDFGSGFKTDAFAEKRNPYGLFDTPEDALAYQKIYTEEKLFLYEADRVIWEVYAVESNAR